jgi:hypothetical protein
MSNFWWILLLVFAFVGGQMLMLRPNQREKAELLLRETARKMGLQPRLIPHPEWLKTESKQFIAYYSIVVPTAKLPYTRAERQVDGSWLTVVGADLLHKAPIPDAAKYLIAIEAQANSVSFYWREEAGIEVLESLKTWFEAMAQ